MKHAVCVSIFLALICTSKITCFNREITLIYFSNKVVEEQYSAIDWDILDVASRRKLMNPEIELIPQRCSAHTAAKPFIQVWYDAQGQMQISHAIKQSIEHVLIKHVREMSKKMRTTQAVLLSDKKLSARIMPIILLAANMIKLHCLQAMFTSEKQATFDYEMALDHMNSQMIHEAFSKAAKKGKPQLTLQKNDPELDKLWHDAAGMSREHLYNHVEQARNELLQQAPPCCIM